MSLPFKQSDVMFRQYETVTIGQANYVLLYTSQSPTYMHGPGPLMHTHSLLELQIISGGRGTLHTESQDYPLKAEDCILIGKNTRHILLSEKNFPIERFEMQIGYRLGEDEGGFPQYLELTRLRHWSGCKKLALFGSAACIEASKRETAYQYQLRAYFTLILTELMRLSGNTELHPQNGPVDNMAVEAVDLMAIDNFLTWDYTITAEELASRLFISRRELFRIFKKYSGETFKQKLISFRIEAARQLLANTDLPISAIAEQVGYNSSASFCKVFRIKTGLTPVAYRDMALKQT